MRMVISATETFRSASMSVGRYQDGWKARTTISGESLELCVGFRGNLSEQSKETWSPSFMCQFESLLYVGHSRLEPSQAPSSWRCSLGEATD